MANLVRTWPVCLFLSCSLELILEGRHEQAARSRKAATSKILLCRRAGLFQAAAGLHRDLAVVVSREFRLLRGWFLPRAARLPRCRRATADEGRGLPGRISRRRSYRHS